MQRNGQETLWMEGMKQEQETQEEIEVCWREQSRQNHFVMNS